MRTRRTRPFPRTRGRAPNDMRRALGGLPFDQRAALIMREVEGRSYAELVEILGVSSADVETLLFRARRALREELERRAHLPSGRAGDLSSARRPARPRRAPAACAPPPRSASTAPRFARGQRTQRAALRALANVPLPASLASFFAKPSGSREQNVGFRARRHLLQYVGDSGLFLLSGSNHPLSTGRRSGGGVLLCVRPNRARVPSAHGSPEQAERRPRLGGVEREQGRGEAQGEVGRAGPLRRVDAPNKARSPPCSPRSAVLCGSGAAGSGDPDES